MSRTIEFDTKEVISIAMQTFWDKGLNTTLSDLEVSTGLNRSSIYNTFGNKEELFRLAMNCYLDLIDDWINKKCSSLSFKAFLKALLEDAATDNFAGRGCFFVNSVGAANTLSLKSKKVLDEAYINIRKMFEKRILYAQDREGLDANMNVSAYATLLMATIAGLRAFNLAGLPKEDLKSVVDTALMRLT